MTRRRAAVLPLVAASGAIVLLAAALSLSVGVQVFSPAQIAGALMGGDSASGAGDLAVTVLRDLRLPRMVTGLAVGAALGLSGALLQLVSRNLLADPGLLGINAGAALAVVLLTALSPAMPALATLATVASLGAALAGLAVQGIAGGVGTAYGAAPLRLVLAGAVMAMALGALTGIVLLLSPGAFEASQIWLAGSVADRSPALVRAYAPLALVLVAAGLALGPAMSLLLLGDAQGRALGARVGRLRLAAVALAAVLCGLSVSLAGPVAFVGLIAPHVARGLGGAHPTPLFALSALWGAALVLVADVIARLVVAPAELPVGLVLAALGVPFYLVLLRRPGLGETQ